MDASERRNYIFVPTDDGELARDSGTVQETDTQ